MKPGLNKSLIYPFFFIHIDWDMSLRGFYFMDDFGSLVLANNSVVHQLTSEFNQYE